MNSALHDALVVFQDDHAWISDNLDNLLEHYADQWIAVRNGQVVGSDPDLAGLVSKLVDPSHTCIEFITSERLEMIL